MMRQFVLGLVVAGLAWWGYSKYVETPANAGGGDLPVGGLPVGNQPVDGAGAGSSGAPVGNQPTGGSQGGGGSVDPSALLDVRGGPGSVPGSAPAVAAPTDLAGLLSQVVAGDPASISKAWHALATGSLGRETARVVAALAPAGEDFASQLAALGSNNSFLHSREGRAAAEKVLQAAMNQTDDLALNAGSQLLYLMTRGRINREDNAARATVDKAYAQHRIRVDRWLCNPANLAGARSYTVKSGDFLDRIARKFQRDGIQVEAGTIQVLNRIHNARTLRVGQKLKVPVAPVQAVLEKRSYALMVFVGQQLLRMYWVGHGEHDRTPVTEFSVVAKQARPQWTAPDGNVYPYGHPKNILGEYFIKFEHAQYSGFGAHGTPMPETICTMASMGCIRMFDADIAELFQVLPRGAKVTVRASESIPR